ncbi:MAG: TlpA family protein disulfide reductase [Christensenellales bacterium]|jgi:thiol-disulfide isomerase/thioredoxin
MNKHTKTFLLIAAFVLLFAVSVFAYNRLGERVSPENRIEVAPGDGDMQSSETEPEKTLAPDFTVLDADGNSVKLSAFIGKPIVLNFWASWCPPCKEEMPEFEKVFQELGTDVTFLMVDLVDGQRETRTKGAQYIKDQGYTFPVYFDTEQDAAKAYGISSIPTTMFIDAQGYIAAGAQGAINEEILRKGIDIAVTGIIPEQ